MHDGTVVTARNITVLSIIGTGNWRQKNGTEGE